MFNTDSNTWGRLLTEAVEKPGIISEAYSHFHNYSLGNQILAIVQCAMRQIQPGPIATFPAWKDKGRFVKKGEKALTLCMPITIKKKAESEGEEDAAFTSFMYRPRWFVISQTDGQAIEPQAAPGWDKAKTLEVLNISEVPFDELSGNVQGYAKKRSISISPIATMPHKTTFHELAHVVLGHTQEADFNDSERPEKSLREVEAESVAMILCESLSLPGAEFSRGYIQHWLSGSAIPEKSAKKIFKAADVILKAGSVQEAI